MSKDELSKGFLITTRSEISWEFQGIRFHAAEGSTGPGAHTVTADPSRATRWKNREDAQREARHGEQVVTMREAWKLVLENPLPSWAQNRKTLLRRAAEVLEE